MDTSRVTKRLLMFIFLFVLAPEKILFGLVDHFTKFPFGNAIYADIITIISGRVQDVELPEEVRCTWYGFLKLFFCTLYYF